MNKRTLLILSAIAAASLAGCAADPKPCDGTHGGLCVSSREMYGVTRNRDQVNPTKNVLKAQQEAGRLINSPPKAKDELPSIHPMSPTSVSAVTPQKSNVTSGLAGGDSAASAASIPGDGPATALYSPSLAPKPLLTQPRVLRVWIAPYEGVNGNLHFPGFVYTVIDPQHWVFGPGSDKAAPAIPGPGQFSDSGE